MAETSFGVTYGGPALDLGQMPVRDLAPALLALADLFVDAGVVLYPDQPPLALNVKAAPQQGSFVVHLLLEGKDAWNQMAGMLASSDVTALLALKELVIGGDISLFGLIKRIRNAHVIKQEQLPDPGWVKLTLDDETAVEIPAGVFKLYRTVSIRKKASAAVAPVRREGIQRVEFHSEQAVSIEITAEDLPAFDLEDSEVVLKEDTQESFLTVVSPVFAEDNKWRLSDGDAVFWVTVEDAAFLARVDASVEDFRKGDMLRCRIRVVQSEKNGKLQTERHLVQVLEHRKAQAQLGLLEPPPAVEPPAAS